MANSMKRKIVEKFLKLPISTIQHDAKVSSLVPWKVFVVLDAWNEFDVVSVWMGELSADIEMETKSNIRPANSKATRSLTSAVNSKRNNRIVGFSLKRLNPRQPLFVPSMEFGVGRNGAAVGREIRRSFDLQRRRFASAERRFREEERAERRQKRLAIQFFPARRDDFRVHAQSRVCSLSSIRRISLSIRSSSWKSAPHRSIRAPFR